MKSESWHRLSGAFLLAVVALSAPPTSASGLSVLNEPCAAISDTYAWVSVGTHDKLYLIMNFFPLQEPGRGNQGYRACSGYRYEFHVGKGESLTDVARYRIEFNTSLVPESAPSPTDSIGGGNELMWQLTGGSETMTVTRVIAPGFPTPQVLGEAIPVLPNNIGPQTDRLVHGLGAYKGYDSGDASSRANPLYDQTFVDTYIRNLSNGGRIIAGPFDDPAQSDEKGLFDIVNLGRGDVGGIQGARNTPIEDVFAGFNVFSIALELPTAELFPEGIPHNGQLNQSSTDSLLRVWSSVSRQATQTVDTSNVITGLRGSGNYVQVGRNAQPHFDDLFVGTQRQTLYLHTSPLKDMTRFGADIIFPVLVRDADAIGLYKALGVPANAVTTLKGPRLDLINAINLGRPIPVANGSTGDVITLDAATDSSFPNGRLVGGGTSANRHQVNVNTYVISLIIAGDPSAGLVKGVEVNDKNFPARFPFLAPAHNGLLQGHGGVNTTVQPDIPNPSTPQPCL